MSILSLLLAATVVPPATLRVEYFHTGNATEERFSLESVVVEPLPWPGDLSQTIDPTGYGAYAFEVRDAKTQRVLYSRGFASIFGEWEGTPEARERFRTFRESLRFPMPPAPADVVLKKRDAQSKFQEVWRTKFDPKSPAVDPSVPPSPGPLIVLHQSGPSPQKVDLLLLGDGYTAAERGKFEKDARRLVDVLFAYSPFKERKADFNVWGLCPASMASGISRPSTGVHRRTPIGATYDAFGAERYILTFEERAFRDAASFAPYEFVEILVNGATYGGGGIYNLYSTVASDSLFAPYVFVHELGHHIGGLADEYFTSESYYAKADVRPEPWEPNVTALADPSKLKWKALATPGLPLPTPWKAPEWIEWQAGVQKKRRQIRSERRPETEMDALFIVEKAESSRRLSAEPHAAKVGAFEGAHYEAKGYYRPQADCVMFTRDDVPFCAVCQQALNRVIDLHVPRARAGLR